MNIYSPSLQVTVYGNFDVVQQTGNVSFPSNGTWYNLFTGTTLTVFGYTASVTLNPGEFYVYVNLQNVLPVSWVDFTGHYQNGGTVALNWSATNELSNDHYDIERSIDGKNFTDVGTVDALRAANGKGVYNYIDVTAPEGKIYYRIKQLDVTGKYSFSKVIAVESSIKTNSWHTFYAGGVVKVLAQTDMNRMNVVLQDASGKVLARQNANNVTNGQVLQLATNTYSKGLYLITVSSDKGIRTDKVIVR
jgi:hypothetical protein